MGAFVGIDLGTTYSVVAYVNEQGKAVTIPNADGKTTTPSVIAFEPGRIIVGEEAKERQLAGESEVASFFKRNMGDANYLYTFAGKDYTPTTLSAIILKHLKQQAENHLHQSVTDAVITVPAYFNNMQRAATIEAGKLAGLTVLKVISEPTAAALAYGLRPGVGSREQQVLVYDLGGGTFDISLIAITAHELTVLATDGNHRLGGKDWDERLLTYLSEQFEQDYQLELIGDDINELRVQVEKLKYALSVKQSANIRVQSPQQVASYTVTRAQFETMTSDLMEQTRLLTERVLAEKGLHWSDLDGVLPVGGSTRMPMVHAFIQRMSGKAPMGGIHPDEAVGLGAAVQATMEREAQDSTVYTLAGRKKTTDVIAHSLGMIAVSEDNTRYLNSILIRKNLAIPSRQTRPYKMKIWRKGDTELEIFLTQGETEEPQKCAYIGRYIFDQFPAQPGKEVVLDISYEYDKNGIVHISAIERASKQTLRLREEPVPSDVPDRFKQSPNAQQPVREHMTIYLAFDLSGSMSGRPLKAAKQAAEEFVKECDLTTTSIGLISFSDRVSVSLEATQNASTIYRAIQSLSEGSTGYGNATDPFKTIYTRLVQVPGLRYAIVLADGVWVHQKAAIIEAKRCHQAQIEVVAVGFGGADERFLRQIASSSEQGIFTDMSRLTETFSTIAQVITEGGTGTGKRGLFLN